RIVHAPVVDADVAKSRAVLRDEDRRRRVVASDTNKQTAETLRIDLPAHVRVRRLEVALHAWAFGARAHNEAEVVVDAEEVQRRGDRLEIAVSDKRRDRLVTLEEVGGIRTAEDRIEEPAVPFAVDLPRRRLVLRRVRGRVRMGQVERDSDPSVRNDAPDYLHGPAVREEEVMSGRDRVGLARAARRVLAPGIPDPGVYPRLVVRD